MMRRSAGLWLGLLCHLAAPLPLAAAAAPAANLGVQFARPDTARQTIWLPSGSASEQLARAAADEQRLRGLGPATLDRPRPAALLGRFGRTTRAAARPRGRLRRCLLRHADDPPA